MNEVINPEKPETTTNNFIHRLIDEDLSKGRYQEIVTRFPPEPNGYLHLGHLKSIVLNFGTAERYGGRCNLRFDDTNPLKEDREYIEAMKRDIKWLGYHWDGLFHASDYFEQLYAWAVKLIKEGKAYVDSLSADEIREYRGNLSEPGKESPYRNRSVEKNLALFEAMRRGEFKEGEHVLRAKIDMASGNINFRDPVMYRILHATHPHTGDTWCIYPSYDWAHGQSDYLEGISHSLCTIEFSNHNPLYEWYLEAIEAKSPRTYQTEFAPLIISYILFSKRNLKRLVEEGYVSGWDDPRLPTIAGMRRRGYTPKGLKDFVEDVGVDRSESVIELSRFEYFIRQDLNKTSQRLMAVLEPIKVTLSNYPEDLVEEFEAVNNHEDLSAGTRKVPFSRELYIEREDFAENPPKGFFRLAPGAEVRLMHAYYITCQEIIKDEAGNITELRCTYDPETRGGDSPDKRKVKGTLHWVSARHALDAEVRLYERLFNKENPKDVEEGQDFTANLNPDSLRVMGGVKLEPSTLTFPDDTHYQFLRKGYFIKDPDSTAAKLVFNRTIDLKDTWAKLQKK
ncbi:MAG: glutamine--tRNA ligase/YqeY domain fusion protein [Deinococcales bacterium]